MVLDPTPPVPGDWRGRMQAFLAQPALKRSLPALAGLGALGGAGLLYLALADGPQRTLYGALTDAERAEVAAALDTAGISYSIDNATGALSVGEDDLYRARMLVASETALATPDSGTAMLDTIPLGASRTMEGERLKLARERELTLTIQEIDGIEAVRVHLATPERSVFVRENAPPSASVMVRLARGRSLTPDQVDAITNLVAASVPGLQGQMVRVVDQNGRLLSAARDGAAEGLALQREHEAKLRDQLDALLIPLLGEGNFTSEVQVELAREESTSARETYDKEGVVQTESENRSTRAAAGAVGGVPGVLANTPPPPAELVPGAPQGTQTQPGAPGTDEESSARRSYALGREVAVTSVAPGGVARISVAVAVSQSALKKIAPANEARLPALVEGWTGRLGDESLARSVLWLKELPLDGAYAARVLAPGGILALYGPYRVDGEVLSPGNRAFDADLRGRHPAWGLRSLADVQAVAAAVGLRFEERVDMPANNLMLRWTSVQSVTASSTGIVQHP